MCQGVPWRARERKVTATQAKYSWIQLAGIGMHDWKQIREVFNLKKYMWISISLNALH